jgi:glutaminase
MSLQALVDDIAARMRRETERGKPASYIPQLATGDPRRFGLCVVPLEGEPAVAGDADMAFSIQSVSKVFTLTLALNTVGAKLWRRVGREPSGDPFNSIVQLEAEKGKPRNPFINAGAILVADVLLTGRRRHETIAEILGFVRRLAGDERIAVDEAVAASEKATGFRNVALANFMKADGNLRCAAERVLDVYFAQCALAMSCRQLAMAGRFLANGGRIPGDPEPVVTEERARRICSLMLTCGHYDASGEFAFRVGIPAKSGVGGGILGVVPGVASIAAWCPGLDETGNSLIASRAFEVLAADTGWSVFAPRKA